MNQEKFGAFLIQRRTQKGLTQEALGRKLSVTKEIISRWERGQGIPNISLFEPLSKALQVSVSELISGTIIENKNISSNLRRSKFYVCTLCGNVIHATGEAVISCCGISLSPLEAKEPDEEHKITLTPVEDEHFITIDYKMTKSHYISFIAFVSGDRLRLVKLYPEGNPETRISIRGGGSLYIYCNNHGLIRMKV
ncbi:MAG: helix-turn-helix domain-containing protein [Clostridiales bacterium]|nr:helix-turn-helix domain-containing protein [Clostridiales bacterium]